MTDGSGDEITLNRQRLIDMVGSFGQIHFRVFGREQFDNREFDGIRIYDAIHNAILDTPDYRDDMEYGTIFRWLPELSDEQVAFILYLNVGSQMMGANSTITDAPDINKIQNIVANCCRESGLLTLSAHFDRYRGIREAYRFIDRKTGRVELTDEEFELSKKFQELGSNLPMILEEREWAASVECGTIEELNEHIRKGTLMDVIVAGNERYSTNLERLRDSALNNGDDVKLHIMSGPSSSGKTWTDQKLVRMLQNEGVAFIPFEADMYFWDTHLHHLERLGAFNYEEPWAARLRQIGEDIEKLLDGKVIEMPVHEFSKGKKGVKELKIEKGTKIYLDFHLGFLSLVSAAIHERFGPDAISKTYIENWTGIEGVNDDDVRFLRRTIRDIYQRGHSPNDTANGWYLQQRSADRYIRARMGAARDFINGTQIHELAILKHVLENYADKKLPDPTNYGKPTSANPDASIRLTRINDLLAKVDIGDGKYMDQVLKWLSPCDPMREFIGLAGLSGYSKDAKFDLMAAYPSRHTYGGSASNLPLKK
ncbi:hypothetical protein HOC35_06890 [Candidatus Woesearchaeota archaeon]|jgi:uridine kinase|nr:hypothetical protein [Candidatus Woesearchaeota archaeon]